MPNWCENVVTVSGDKERLTKFKKFVKGTCIVSSEYKATTKKGKKTWEEVMFKTPKTVEIPFSFKSIMPYKKEWDYNWCVKNWGVKWDLDDETRTEEDGDYLEYCFDTAWGPPYGIHQTLTAKFPDLHITWFYHEPMMEIAGYLEGESQTLAKEVNNGK